MCPIKNLTERRRLPRLGRIRIGEKVESKTKPGVFYPHAVEYFVLPPEVAKVYKEEKPKSLDIMFPVDDEGTFASQFYRAYSQTRGLVCKGDGETASRLIDVATKTGETETGVVTGEIAKHTAKEVEWIEGIICPGHDCPYYKAKQCREIMNLQFLLPEVPGLGVWQLDTSSYNSILNINSALALVRAIFGTVQGVPLLLTVEPMEVSPDGKKKTVHVLNLRTKVTLRGLAEARRKGLQSLQLPPSDEEMPELLYPTPEQEEARAADEAESIEAQATTVEVAVQVASPASPPKDFKVLSVTHLISAEQQERIRVLAKAKGILSKDADQLKFDAGVRIVTLSELTDKEGDKIIAFLEKKDEKSVS